jgi:thioesterase domain-containing protein
MFDSMCPLLAQRRPPLPVRMWRRRHRTIEDVLEWRRRRAHRALIRRHLARDETIPEDLREVHLFDSYMKAQACYRPAPLHTSLLLFRASQDDPGFRKERLLGWHRLVTGPIEVHMIEADHLGMMSPANIEIMHAILQKRLDEIDGQLAL